jgi:hypothetical protein
LTLNGGNLNIATGRTLTASGNVTLGANIVDSAGTLALGATSSITRSIGQVESIFKKTFGATGAFVFPVGTTGAYSPVNVAVTAGAGDLSVKANAGTAPSTLPINDATTLDRYWTLEGGITSDITFNYLRTDVDGNEAAYNVIRSPSGGGAPVVRYAPNGTSIILDAANNFFTVKGLQSYSNWTAGEPVAPTAAAVGVGGRIVNASGVAVSNAQISMVDADGNIRIARTNPFGYYRFTGVSVGANYTISVRHKFYEFAPRVLFVEEDSDAVDFVANH